MKVKMNESDAKVFNVQRIRFCNIFNVEHTTEFSKELLMEIINSNIDGIIEYNNTPYTVTFPMKHLARQLLLVEYHTYT